MATPAFIISDPIGPAFSGAISLHACEFSAARYNDQLFQQYAIHYSTEIANAVTKRRAEFLAGRYCAKKSLAALDGTTGDIHIGNFRNPVWPPHVVGSISHTNSHAVAVTALKSNLRGIGIDVQDEFDRDTYLKIKTQIIFADEDDFVLQNLQGLTTVELLTIAFSVKESFFKAAFAEVGRYLDFNCVSITQIDQQAQLIRMRVNEHLSKYLTAGTRLQAEYRRLSERRVMTLVRLD